MRWVQQVVERNLESSISALSTMVQGIIRRISDDIADIEARWESAAFMALANNTRFTFTA